jgi:hypothetical protein
MKGDMTKNRSSDFLDKLEHSSDLNSVGTDQLLDILDQEISNSTDLPKRESNTKQPRRSAADRHERVGSALSEGYTSGDSVGSFTSSFLGGLEEDAALSLEREVRKHAELSNSNGGNESNLNNSFTARTIEHETSPVKTGNYSDGNMSSSSLRRQPFDNPFRSQKQGIFHKKDDTSSVGGVSTSSKSKGAMSAAEGRRVSFSSKDPHHQTTSPRSVSKKFDLDKDSTADTFSLGSLGSLAVTASTRSGSLQSHFTKHTRSSKSSRSSRSSHTSAASSQSSASARERRQRRELQPVKSSHSNTGTRGSLGSSSRRRRRSGGDGKDIEMGTNTNKRRNHADLHSHHPTRYPKRSGMYGQIDEEDESSQDDAFDEIYGELVMAANGSDDEGLFRRVDRVKKSIQNHNGNTGFLDSLLESQPLVNKTSDNTDDQSVGEKSFLSDFLHNRAVQNGTTKQRKGASSASKSSSVAADDINDTFKDKCQNYANNSDSINVARQHVAAAYRKVQQLNKDGYLLPTSRVEFVKYGLLALILAPMIHVFITIVMGGKGDAGKSVRANSNLNPGNSDLTEQFNTVSSAKADGSSYVMLSSSSSVRENIILVPDADWFDLPPRPPKRVALPTRLDPRGRPDSAIVLFTLSASKSDGDTTTNTNANNNLWESIRSDLQPKPLDAWPSWYHNSVSHVREDGFTIMYPIRKREDAKNALTQLTEEVGRSQFYEFVTFDESSIDEDVLITNVDLHPLPRKQTDVMIRRTISTGAAGRGKSKENEESVLVLRRVQDLPQEDDLTLRDFQGPALDDVVWNKSSR